ncbi:uncharacterized protein LOC116255423 isoform X3 [Nymphaea colorata]|uniref:uncharacterized protein LOC116255423 isoform X3 n=1 Tax=Nymphaea colorata TaxID=210225 RepID=UPI00214E2CA0|nr:uncharacterized protein LOC116255423 isoform X3 [Nymphaea colorata]
MMQPQATPFVGASHASVAPPMQAAPAPFSGGQSGSPTMRPPAPPFLGATQSVPPLMQAPPAPFMGSSQPMPPPMQQPPPPFVGGSQDASATTTHVLTVRLPTMAESARSDSTSFTDETPCDYYCNLGPDGRRRDADERPELCRGTVEFVASKEYMVRDPMPAVFFFLVDVSMNAIQSGATAAACSAVSQSINDLPLMSKFKAQLISVLVDVQWFWKSRFKLHESLILYFKIKFLFEFPIKLWHPI